MSFYTDYPLYPTSVFTLTDFPILTDDVDWTRAKHVNALKDELRAALTELGTTPKGTFADVAARLADFTTWRNNTQSSGKITGGNITTNGDGTATVAAGTCYLKTTDSELGLTNIFSWAEDSNVVLADNDINYVYVKYDTPNPTIEVTQDRSTINYNIHFPLGRVYRDGFTLHILNSGLQVPNFLRKEHERLITVRSFEHASGAIVSETGTRNLASTAGVLYLGLNRITTTSQDTSAADRFTSWYRDGIGGWTQVNGQAQVDNQNYDDGSGALQALTANRYAVFWIFIHYDSDLHLIYGQGNYKLAQAEAASTPDSLPEQVEDFGILAAKIIIKKSAAGFTSIVTAYKTLFPVSSPPDHNDLGAIQGGAADDYYHLTAAEYAQVGGFTGSVVNIFLNAFRILMNGGLSRRGFLDGFADEFEDETGIDGGLSNANYNDTDDYYFIGTVLEEEFTTVTNPASIESLGRWFGEAYNDKIAMSFEIPNTRDIKEIQVYLDRFGTPGNITVRIETDAAGHASGSLANPNLTGTILESASSDTAAWLTLTFATAGELTANTTYWLVLSLAADPGNGNTYRLYGDADNTYPDGHYEYHEDGGAWADGTQIVDMAFKIFYQLATSTLVSNAEVATAAPANALIVAWADPGTGDITYYVSRDDGTTWTEITLAEIMTESGTMKAYQGEDDISAQPSDTDMRLKAVITGNAKLYAWGLEWL